MFDGPDGKETLADLFAGRSQLIVYHFMFGPGWEEGCPSCSFLADHFDGAIVHLAQARRDAGRGLAGAAAARSRPSSGAWAGASSGCRPTATTSTATTTCRSRRTRWPRARSTTTTTGATFPSEEAPGASVFYQDDAGDDLPHLLDLRPRARHPGRRLQLPRPRAQGPRRGRARLHHGLGPAPRPVRPIDHREAKMAKKVLILLGTKKGAFILESDARAALVGAARPVLRDLADEPRHRRSGDRHDLRRRRQRVVRPGGLEVHRSRRHLDPFERGPRLRGGRGADQGGLEPGAGRRAASTPGVEPAGLFRSDDGGQSLAARRRPARPPVAAALAAGRRRADPALAGAAPERRAAALGRDLRGRRVPHRRRRRDLGAAQPRHARATTCRRTSGTRNTASACTAW